MNQEVKAEVMYYCRAKHPKEAAAHKPACLHLKTPPLPSPHPPHSPPLICSSTWETGGAKARSAAKAERASEVQTDFLEYFLFISPASTGYLLRLFNISLKTMRKCKRYWIVFLFFRWREWWFTNTKNQKTIPKFQVWPGQQLLLVFQNYNRTLQ